MLRIDLEDHAILVALRVDRRHLALRIGVGERRIDVLDAHAEARGGRPVDLDVELEAALLAVGRDVHHARHVLHVLDRTRHPFQQLVEVGAPQRELVLRAAPAAADAHVLRRKHPHLDARDAREFRPQPVDHPRGRHIVALGQRLQADEHAALVDRGAPRRAADRGADARDRRIGQDDVERLELHVDHRLVGDVRRGARRGEDQPGVVLREKALRRLDVEVDGERDGRRHHHQHQHAVLAAAPAGSSHRRAACARAPIRPPGRSASRCGSARCAHSARRSSA